MKGIGQKRIKAAHNVEIWSDPWERTEFSLIKVSRRGDSIQKRATVMGRDSSGHICPWCSLVHHRSPLAAWRSCVPVSSRQDIPVGWGWGRGYPTAAPSGPCPCLAEPLCQAEGEDTALQGGQAGTASGKLGSPEGCSTTGLGMATLCGHLWAQK